MGFVLISICLLSSTVRAQNDACYESMECQTNAALQAVREKNTTLLCRVGPGIVECAEMKNRACNNEEMTKQNQEQINVFKNMLRECGKVDTTVTKRPDLVSFKKCSELFQTCLTSEFQHAKHNNNETLCRLLPGVVTCMENALSKCQVTSDEQLRLNELSNVLDGIKKQYPLMSCGCNPELSNCNQANFLMTSILHTCFAIILAVILH